MREAEGKVQGRAKPLKGHLLFGGGASKFIIVINVVKTYVFVHT